MWAFDEETTASQIMKSLIFTTTALLLFSTPAWTEEPEASITVVIDNNELPGHTWVYGTCVDKSIFLSFGPIDSAKNPTDNEKVNKAIQSIDKMHQESTSLYETGKQTARRTFKVSAKQCANMFAEIESDQGAKYKLLTNNCTTVVLDVLKAGGITIPKGDQQFIPVNMGIISPVQMEQRLNEFVNPTEPKAKPPAAAKPAPPKKKEYDGPRGISDRAERAIERVRDADPEPTIEGRVVEVPDPDVEPGDSGSGEIRGPAGK